MIESTNLSLPRSANQTIVKAKAKGNLAQGWSSIRAPAEEISIANPLGAQLNAGQCTTVAQWRTISLCTRYSPKFLPHDPTMFLFVAYHQ